MKYYYLLTENSEEKFSKSLTSIINCGLSGNYAGEYCWVNVRGWKIEGNIAIALSSGKDAQGYPYTNSDFSILLSLDNEDKVVKE